MNGEIKLSDGTGEQLVSHFFMQLPQKNKELFMKKLFKNLSDNCAADLIKFCQDPVKAELHNNFQLYDLVEVRVENLPYSSRKALEQQGYDLSEFVQAKIVDFEFNSSIDMVLEIFSKKPIDLSKVSEYYCRKLEFM